jgi:hypothetical protein
VNQCPSFSPRQIKHECRPTSCLLPKSHGLTVSLPPYVLRISFNKQSWAVSFSSRNTPSTNLTHPSFNLQPYRVHPFWTTTWNLLVPRPRLLYLPRSHLQEALLPLEESSRCHQAQCRLLGSWRSIFQLSRRIAWEMGWPKPRIPAWFIQVSSCASRQAQATSNQGGRITARELMVSGHARVNLRSLGYLWGSWFGLLTEHYGHVQAILQTTMKLMLPNRSCISYLNLRLLTPLNFEIQIGSCSQL